MNLNTPTLLLFPTLACDQACLYCTNHYGDHSGTIPSQLGAYRMAETEQWVGFLSGLTVPSVEILGGEPGIVKGLAAMVDAIPESVGVMVGTNAGRNAIENLLKITPRRNVHIQSTFHPSQTSIEMYAANIKRLLAAGLDVGCHTVQFVDPAHGDLLLRETGISMTSHGLISDETGMVAFNHPSCNYREPARTIKCPTNWRKLVAPNGDIYTCHALMYAKSPIGIIGNAFLGWVADGDTITCPLYGKCNPCDVGRFIKRQPKE